MHLPHFKNLLEKGIYTSQRMNMAKLKDLV